MKPTMTMLPRDAEDEQIDEFVAALRAEVAERHYGPGPHKTGTPQTAHAGKGAVGELGSKSNPIVTDDVVEAAEAIGQGKYVVLTSEDMVTVLLDELQKMAKEAEARGEKAPVYNLCRVTVPGTSIFCVESKGIPRIKMPQLKAKPIPGTPAAELTPDPEGPDAGEVDLYAGFMDRLRDRGVDTRSVEVIASHLKASQNELNGVKVAKLMGLMRRGEFKVDADDNPTIVSRDNYIIDGHHRWAAQVGLEYAGTEITLPVTVVDMDVLDLLDEANAYAKDMGMPGVGVGAPGVK